MGEMADYYLENAFYDDDGLEPEDENYPSKTCKHCGESGFHWGQTKDGWRLFSSDKVIHNCPKFAKRSDHDQRTLRSSK